MADIPNMICDHKFYKHVAGQGLIESYIKNVFYSEHD